MSIRLICLYAVMLLGLALAGCGDRKKEEEVKAFVKKYASVLQESYATGNMAPLSQLATEKELRKMAPLMQALNTTNSSMKTEISEFKIDKVKVSENEATVKTTQKWRYWWVSRSTGLITKQKQEESYKLEYTLFKMDGRWMVDSINKIND